MYITIATHKGRRKTLLNNTKQEGDSPESHKGRRGTLSNYTKAGEEHFPITQSRRETLLNNTKQEGN